MLFIFLLPKLLKADEWKSQLPELSFARERISGLDSPLKGKAERRF